MFYPCPLCGRSLKVGDTKKGGYFTKCLHCKSYFFVNGPEGKSLLEGKSSEEGSSNPSELSEMEGAISGNPGPSSSAFSQELDALKARVAKIESDGEQIDWDEESEEVRSDNVIQEVKKLRARIDALEESSPDEDEDEIVCAHCGIHFDKSKRGVDDPLFGKRGIYCPGCEELVSEVDEEEGEAEEEEGGLPWEA